MTNRIQRIRDHYIEMTAQEDCDLLEDPNLLRFLRDDVADLFRVLDATGLALLAVEKTAHHA